jgi:hypothetical protein
VEVNLLETLCVALHGLIIAIIARVLVIVRNDIANNRDYNGERGGARRNRQR